MPLHDLDGAYAIHATLGAIFERERGGTANPKILELVSGLCDRAVDAVTDVDCRVAIRGVKSFASLLYSDDGWKDVDLGPFRGVDAVRVQIINALTAFRARVDALQRRRPSRPELPALVPKQALRVLIVEDNPDAATSLFRLLEVCGYSVMLATTASEAFEAAKRTRPDVILCDIGLPDYDGYALAAAFKEDPDTASIRLIAVTAYGKQGDYARSREAGFELHLVKPVSPSRLLRELAEAPTPKATGGA